MSISFVMAVMNNVELTINCYMRIRELYPSAEIVISSAGSTDETNNWLTSLEDDHITYDIVDQILTFSDNWNNAIRLVKTPKLVLIHNDMVIGKGFLESLEQNITEDTLLSYTTIEPPIFDGHERPGKVIMELGRSFNDFDITEFDLYCIENCNYHNITKGATFFMSGYKSMFENVGYFDGVTFNPFFCEDDDFVFRAHLKGYKLKTLSSAIVYHFVSKTSRFSKDYEHITHTYEIHSNRNFTRKWGVTNQRLHSKRYWETDYQFKKYKVVLIVDIYPLIVMLEPYFDKVVTQYDWWSYIQQESPYTSFILKEKFVDTDDCDAVIKIDNLYSGDDHMFIDDMYSQFDKLEVGVSYKIGNLSVKVHRKV